MKTYIKGNYRRSIFESENGYVIGLFKVKETNIDHMEDYLNKTVTFTGYFHDLNLEDHYIFYGEELEHPKYGFQFQVTEYERLKPSDKDGIVEFLSSDLFHGIGEKMAKKIVDVLGENTLERILNEPECLNLVPKLSKKKQDQLKETLEKYEESHQTIVYLTELGFSMKDSLLIYNQYKGNTVSKIEHNIFELLHDIAEITFPKLDEISKKLGYDPSDDRRMEACIIYVMEQKAFQQGDTFFYLQEVMQAVQKHLHMSITKEQFTQYFQDLAMGMHIVLDDDKIALMKISEAEDHIAFRIKQLRERPKNEYKQLEKQLKQLETANGIIYNEKQKQAILSALWNNITIITGGPGTGKTTIIKAIVELYGTLHKLSDDALDEQICLLAPTGRASKRMSESTLHSASTIHRFLKWNKENNQFAVNEYYPDFSKFIIVDEVSMIDVNLLDSLLKGLTDHIQLVLVGDYNQLPSVGPGQLLKDMIDSNVIETIHLDLLYRQDENSYISTLASEIKDDRLSDRFIETHSDYTFLQCSSNHIRHNLKQLCETLLAKGYHEKRVQIMAPMYRGENGIDILNKEMQAVFNPPSLDKIEVTYGDVIFREHDKILQLVNMPDENVFNGDIGEIDYIIPASRSKSGKNEIYVNYDGTVVKYLPKDYLKIKHGFVITIHKSQGSEFEVVIMPITHGYHRMLYRKLVYTGITRAKRKLILLGEAKAFSHAVHNNQEYIRKTALKEKLQRACIDHL